eukprot:gnl/Carplike_NY0171/3015_a4050_212.p2 GENE.gnl/Carplike_NY0171/3015_a4050_212~~gnl/Carplike_NY0171/3015_a4050_212.p2  ORF type:complete len:252 (-),score=51.30 gnl/Carplike_NY0171/3015_a4050_212:105-860(-)
MVDKGIALGCNIMKIGREGPSLPGIGIGRRSISGYGYSSSSSSFPSVGSVSPTFPYHPASYYVGKTHADMHDQPMERDYAIIKRSHHKQPNKHHHTKSKHASYSRSSQSRSKHSGSHNARRSGHSSKYDMKDSLRDSSEVSKSQILSERLAAVAAQEISKCSSQLDDKEKKLGELEEAIIYLAETGSKLLHKHESLSHSAIFSRSSMAGGDRGFRASMYDPGKEEDKTSLRLEKIGGLIKQIHDLESGVSE